MHAYVSTNGGLRKEFSKFTTSSRRVLFYRTVNLPRGIIEMVISCSVYKWSLQYPINYWKGKPKSGSQIYFLHKLIFSAVISNNSESSKIGEQRLLLVIGKCIIARSLSQLAILSSTVKGGKHFSLFVIKWFNKENGTSYSLSTTELLFGKLPNKSSLGLPPLM